MSRSLYSQLNQRFGPRVSELTRRELLQASAAAGAALLLSTVSRGMVRWPEAQLAGGRKRVVVVGGGLAGLACAYELRAAGYDAIVLEARERVGGRVLSFNLALENEFIADRNVEGGAEFIGTNHPIWCAYAAKFGLDKLMIKEGEGLTYPVVIDGKRLDDKAASDLWDSMSKALNSMNALAATVDADEPWKSPKAAELDKRTVQSWIDALDADKLTKRACWINLCGDNGADPAGSSLLGELAAVKGGGLERFWKETETWRCKGGNSLLASRLANEVGEDHVQLGVAAAKIEQRGEGVRVSTKDGRLFECDDVVLAVPPSVWAGIEFAPGLPATLKPRMGANVKYLAHTKTRFWLKDKVSSDGLSDGAVQMTWDGTEGQDGEKDGCLVAFSGGPSAAKCLAFTKETRDAEYGKLMRTLYPQWDGEFLRSRFMDWTKDPWTKGSYSFPAPGEVTTMGPLMAKGHMEKDGKSRLHFAGEHTCYKFVGYMEGALQSGVRVAKAIAARDGVTNSK